MNSPIGHLGDPCIFCKKNMEDVEIGDCRAREGRGMLIDAIGDLQTISHHGPNTAIIYPREAKAIVEQLQELVWMRKRSDQELCRILGITPRELDNDTTQRD